MNPIYDTKPETRTFLQDVLEGLSNDPKTLSCKYFYDEYGSKLFERISGLDEYYPTRTEWAILNEHADEMAELLGPECMVVEPGSGTAEKAAFLLSRMKHPAAFVPIEISREYLVASSEKLDKAFHGVEVLPVCADFHQLSDLPDPEIDVRRKVLYFPGSTIGNFNQDVARSFLRRFVDVIGPGGAMLIGVDLVKDKAVLERAYNDADGVTAAFNLNLLRRINQELGGKFTMHFFEHKAFFNEAESRIEMHLESAGNQDVRIGDRTFHFDKGETICTEYSHKYTIDSFTRLVDESGAEIKKVWTDDKQYFAVAYATIS